MRLFTGISLPPGVLSKVEQAVETLRPLAHVRWLPTANLHITTKFIGEWPEDRLQELKAALGGMPRPGTIPIRIAGFGFLPGGRRPRIFFARVDSGERLPELARLTNEALAPLGCAIEERVYWPHLTLAKLKDDNIQGLRNYTEKIPDTDFGSFDASNFHLYLSKPGPDGSVYTELATWSLS